jgi:hypothetical protein
MVRTEGLWRLEDSEDKWMQCPKVSLALSKSYSFRLKAIPGGKKLKSGHLPVTVRYVEFL